MSFWSWIQNLLSACRKHYPPPVTYLFEDEFDGPAGSPPDATKWHPPDDVNTGLYTNSTNNLFVDGDSNLVIRATNDGGTYHSAWIQTKDSPSPGEGGFTIGHTFEARIKFPFPIPPGCHPSWWMLNRLSPKQQDEIDIWECYGNGSWANGTTVWNQAANTYTNFHPIDMDNNWHTWRCVWDTTGLTFYRDYTDATSQPYFTVAPDSIGDWHYNDSGLQMFLILNNLIGDAGGGTPNPADYPVDMLVDWVRVW
jgi:hypothetical protein